MTAKTQNMSRMTQLHSSYNASPEPTIVRTNDIRASNLGWWIGTLVAVVAIVAAAFLFTRPTPASIARAQSDAALQNAAQAANTARAIQYDLAQAAKATNAAQAAADTPTPRRLQVAKDAAVRAEAAASDADQAATVASEQANSNAAAASVQSGDGAAFVLPTPMHR